MFKLEKSKFPSLSQGNNVARLVCLVILASSLIYFTREVSSSWQMGFDVRKFDQIAATFKAWLKKPLEFFGLGLMICLLFSLSKVCFDSRQANFSLHPGNLQSIFSSSSASSRTFFRSLHRIMDIVATL